MRNRFDEQLNNLNNELITMGALCEEAISAAVKLLVDNDVKMKESVLDADKQIDQKERDIETLCMKLLMQQQPVASDLRTISSALKMISDMERIGDQAADIAEISKYLANGELPNREHLMTMNAFATEMVTRSILSFVNGDLEMARQVILDDDQVDECFAQVKEDLIAAVACGGMNGHFLLDVLMVAKYMERIGDHATNIAEWVVYSITGAHPEEEN